MNTLRGALRQNSAVGRCDDALCQRARESVKRKKITSAPWQQRIRDGHRGKTPNQRRVDFKAKGCWLHFRKKESELARVRFLEARRCGGPK